MPQTKPTSLRCTKQSPNPLAAAESIADLVIAYDVTIAVVSTIIGFYGMPRAKDSKVVEELLERANEEVSEIAERLEAAKPTPATSERDRRARIATLIAWELYCGGSMKHVVDLGLEGFADQCTA